MNKQDMIKDAIANHWNVRDEYKNKSLDELQAICKNEALPYAVCAINITGDLNLGMMIRTASLCGAERFIIYGKQTYDRRSTVGAQNYIDVVKIDAKVSTHSLDINYEMFHPTMIEYRYIPVFMETDGLPLEPGLEQVLELIKLHTDPAYKYKPCLVFGNEGVGLPASLTHNMIKLSINQRGVLRSFNVSSAASIAMYQLASILS